MSTKEECEEQKQQNNVLSRKERRKMNGAIVVLRVRITVQFSYGM
jgi:hypothetical protein